MYQENMSIYYYLSKKYFEVRTVLKLFMLFLMTVGGKQGTSQKYFRMVKLCVISNNLW